MTGAEPRTRTELGRALSATRDEVADYFAALSPGAFMAGSDDAWSPAHHLDHLIRSTMPVAAGLSIPRHLLAPREPEEVSRSYAEIRGAYHGALERGLKAAGRFLPRVQGTQAELVGRYRDTLDALLEQFGPWTELELDGCSMPHPVLGNLSVREMLYFTHYHNHHHLRGVQLLHGRDTPPAPPPADGTPA